MTITTEFDEILNNPFTAKATVVADSISPEGVRLSTVEEVFWRPVLAERNTHKNQYGNSASSRAIPVEKTLRKFREEPAYPTSWPAEQPGMSGGAELSGENLEDALRLWKDCQEYIGSSISDYLATHPDKSTRLHKSVINRLMEFGQWHTRVTTATAWQNFFDQRCHEDAQPEIQDVAILIRHAMEESTPMNVDNGEWHLPYIGDDEVDLLSSSWRVSARVSAARCARTSYETQAGVRDPHEDLRLYDRLITERVEAGLPIHWSPLEHVATPDASNRQIEPLRYWDNFAQHHRVIDCSHLPKTGALVGWRNLRTMEEANAEMVTFR